MKLPGKVLVVGADGVIGSALVSALSQAGSDVLGSSRRSDSKCLRLDLGAPVPTASLPDAQTVFLCAGINGFAACDADPALASRVNIEATLAIGTHYLQRAAHVAFLSSTAVFGSRGDAPGEMAVLSPNTTYGAFKCASEVALQAVASSAPGPFTIVRLTKVLSAQTPLLQKWRSAVRDGMPVNAYSDSMVCPVSLSYVVQGLLKIAQRKAPGCFHLAGAQTLSYAALAQALVQHRLLPHAVVRETSQGSRATSGVQEQCVSLTMPLTAQTLGIRAQSFADCLQNL
jgi:dTDP-4-dehydrorhamnose reductase